MPALAGTESKLMPHRRGCCGQRRWLLLCRRPASRRKQRGSPKAPPAARPPSMRASYRRREPTCVVDPCALIGVRFEAARRACRLQVALRHDSDRGVPIDATVASCKSSCTLAARSDSVFVRAAHPRCGPLSCRKLLPLPRWSSQRVRAVVGFSPRSSQPIHPPQSLCSKSPRLPVGLGFEM